LSIIFDAGTATQVIYSASRVDEKKVGLVQGKIYMYKTRHFFKFAFMPIGYLANIPQGFLPVMYL
jgi:hypothetical protein